MSTTPRTEHNYEDRGGRGCNLLHHRIDPSRLIEATKHVCGDDFEHKYGPILPIPESQVQAAADRATICSGGRKLRIIHAPYALRLLPVDDFKYIWSEKRRLKIIRN